MTKKLFFLLLLPLLAHADWGKTGHRVIGEIAAHHLKPKAKKAISALLEGRSLARIGTWADEIRSNPDYDAYVIWHYVNLPLDKRYEEVEHQGENVVTAIEACIKGLKDPSTPQAKKAFTSSTWFTAWPICTNPYTQAVRKTKEAIPSNSNILAAAPTFTVSGIQT